ncbi:MAG: UPF0280 family protein [Candidatus Omnitrophota bacterium]|nr:UPF0280 family protein [Candidatus Omnitrophota bacterium]
MKTDKYQRRFYRDWPRSKDLSSTRILTKETDVQIWTDKPLNKEFAQERIKYYRWQIENYITRDARFLTSLKPLSVELNASQIIKEISEQAKKANVGPMASVAGTIAEFLGRDLIKKGYRQVIIENGGDIFIKTTRIRKVGIYSGRSKLWNKICLKIKPKDTPLGICASSGTIGHSVSFGCADSVVIISKSASLADAVATATANRVNSKQEMQSALDFARSVKGVLGVVIILKNNFMSWGKVELDSL